MMNVRMEEKMYAEQRKSLYGFEFREVDGRRRNGRKTHDIKQLWQRSHEIINLASTGMKGTEIARVLDIAPQTVSNTLNSELGMHKLSDIRGEKDESVKKINEKIEKLTAKALDVYEEIFENTGESVPLEMRKKTADTVMLELSGHRAPVRTESRSFSASATLEEIEEFKKRGLEAARARGLLVDVTPRGEREEEGEKENADASRNSS